MKTLQLFLLGIFVLGVTSCATVIDGKTQEVTFNSVPDGATVTVAGRILGKTPITIRLDKETNQVLTFEKEGYKTYTTQLSTHMDGWFWGNIVIGGLLGSTTDGMTGAMHEYSPDQYMVTLVSDGPFGMSNDNSRRIKELVLGFGDAIRKQLVTSAGEELNQLIALVDPQKSNPVATTAALGKLATSSKDDLDFANKIIEFYGIK